MADKSVSVDAKMDAKMDAKRARVAVGILENMRVMTFNVDGLSRYAAVFDDIIEAVKERNPGRISQRVGGWLYVHQGHPMAPLVAAGRSVGLWAAGKRLRPWAGVLEELEPLGLAEGARNLHVKHFTGEGLTHPDPTAFSAELARRAVRSRNIMLPGTSGPLKTPVEALNAVAGMLSSAVQEASRNKDTEAMECAEAARRVVTGLAFLLSFSTPPAEMDAVLNQAADAHSRALRLMREAGKPPDFPIPQEFAAAAMQVKDTPAEAPAEAAPAEGGA